MSANRLSSNAEARHLGEHILSPARLLPLVAVTRQSYLASPLVDVDRLGEALAGKAEVWLVGEPRYAWELTDVLPPGMDVYGGQVRLWYPSADLAVDDERRHPLLFVYSPEDAARLVDRLVRLVEATGSQPPGRAPAPNDARGRLARAEQRSPEKVPPPTGSRVEAVVHRVFRHGAQLMLDTGHVAFCVADYIADGVVDAHEALIEGQQVTCRMSPAAHGGDLRAAIQPYAPNAYERFAEQVSVGQLVEGVVDQVPLNGAWVVVLPGVYAWLARRDILPAVRDPADALSVDDRVTVRVVSMDPGEGQVTVAMTDLEGRPVGVVPRLFPDGPRWLTDADSATVSPPDSRPLQDVAGAPEIASPPDADEAPDAPPAAAPASPSADATPNTGQHSEGTDPESLDGTQGATPTGEPAVAPGTDRDVPVADARPQQAEATSTPDDVSVEDAAADKHADRSGTGAQSAPHRPTEGAPAPAPAEEARRRLDQLIERLEALDRTERSRSSRLATQATDVAARLDASLRQAESRFGRLAARRSEQINDMEERVRVAEARAADLERRLLDTEIDRRALQEDRREERANADSALAAVASQRDLLAAQLAAVDGGDPAHRFLREVHFAYEQLYAAEADRAQWPFGVPVLGPAFLESVGELQGVSRTRVQEVCAHVCAGRAWHMSGLDLHQLRSGPGPDDPPRVRSDGATAWRVALQRNAPAARRLHYWQLAGGRIELARVGVHDDFRA